MTFSIYLALVVIGWLMVYAVSYEDETRSSFFQSTAGKQSLWIGISFFTLVFIQLLDYKIWQTFAYLLYA
ncbi:MAG: hypothetical protein R3350_05265, partial [Saprospiraceae bacterium]|nr:hypothetical protein [Saprospiraceae bacterium]